MQKTLPNSFLDFFSLFGYNLMALRTKNDLIKAVFQKLSEFAKKCYVIAFLTCLVKIPLLKGLSHHE